MSAERTSLGISGRIAAAFQASRMTPLLALVALLMGISPPWSRRARKSRRST
jgi:hypothetical protein